MLTSATMTPSISACEIDKLSWRPFGERVEDLEIDFHQPSRPALETQILACCISNCQGKIPNQNVVWNLEISKRTEYLLTLATLPQHSKVNINLRCSNSKCQQQMEIDIPLLELSRLNQQFEENQTEIIIGNQQFSLRRPTGNDQLAWLEQPFSDATSAIIAMVQTLLPEQQKTAFQQICRSDQDWIPIVDCAMEQSDPFVNFSLQVRCPYCETQNLQNFDLGAWALRQLYEIQQQLLATVHRLASHYHWSEAEIFAIPPWRRARYLTIIEWENNR